MSIESVMPSNHLILCRPLLLLPSIFPSIRVFSNESVLRIRWSKYWSLSFSISPFNVVSLEKSKLRHSAGIRRLLFEGGSRRGLVEGEPCCRWGVGWDGVWHGALGLSKHLKRTSPSCLPPQASISPQSPGGRGHSPAAARGPLCLLTVSYVFFKKCLMHIQEYLYMLYLHTSRIILFCTLVWFGLLLERVKSEHFFTNVHLHVHIHIPLG